MGVRRFGRTGRLAKGNAGHCQPAAETELLKPVSDLLHRGSAPDYRASPARIG
jgi:hypothetical protein